MTIINPSTLETERYFLSCSSLLDKLGLGSTDVFLYKTLDNQVIFNSLKATAS